MWCHTRHRLNSSTTYFKKLNRFLFFFFRLPVMILVISFLNCTIVDGHALAFTWCRRMHINSLDDWLWNLYLNLRIAINNSAYMFVHSASALWPSLIPSVFTSVHSMICSSSNSFFYFAYCSIHHDCDYGFKKRECGAIYFAFAFAFIDILSVWIKGKIERKNRPWTYKMRWAGKCRYS